MRRLQNSINSLKPGDEKIPPGNGSWLFRRLNNTWTNDDLLPSVLLWTTFFPIKCVWKTCNTHDDVIKWKHFPRYWPLVRWIHRSLVNSPHKGQWRGALMFSLICVWINGWVNNREAGDLRRYRAHYNVTVMGGRPFCSDFNLWKTLPWGDSVAQVSLKTHWGLVTYIGFCELGHHWYRQWPGTCWRQAIIVIIYCYMSTRRPEACFSEILIEI